MVEGLVIRVREETELWEERLSEGWNLPDIATMYA
jgi:hypothetical protein